MNKKSNTTAKAKTIEQVIEQLEQNNISVYPYEEEGKLCGYELNTYTPAGVNEIIFLDFRDKGDAKSVSDFKKEFKSYMNDRTIDERIDTNRQNEAYKRDFTLSESLKDFKQWERDIKKLIKNI